MANYVMVVTLVKDQVTMISVETELFLRTVQIHQRCKKSNTAINM